MNKPQLIAPAGDWPSLVTAVECGADAVYFGIKGMNMRNYADNFDILELDKVMDFLREHRKKGYLALNTIVLNKELNKVKKILTAAAAARV
ncbi:MAG: U32 family peptidase, partial [Candidatus Omnitrophota bacterium]